MVGGGVSECPLLYIYLSCLSLLLGPSVTKGGRGVKWLIFLCCALVRHRVESGRWSEWPSLYIYFSCPSLSPTLHLPQREVKGVKWLIFLSCALVRRGSNGWRVE
ncbi:hypothetical protein E2C01_085771 [Portunus trituberculatus]|uniref:Secreted protein n=1 Tax=Portunus trituberculatus TaxID=210409 RepID=A0A5B7J3M2_PORTR|nr:hypothetical protein [Portunus trituberculatus]